LTLDLLIFERHARASPGEGIDEGRNKFLGENDRGSAATAQKEASLLMYINVLAITFSSWQNKVIDDEAYKSRIESFFLNLQRR